MIRRQITVSCPGVMAADSSCARAAITSPPAEPERSQARPDKPRQHLSFLLFEGMTALDFLGPATVLTASGQFAVDYVWRDKNPVYAESSVDKCLGFMPTATFGEIRETDILCVPGTSNPYAPIMQEDILEWVGNVGSRAEWVTSVCTGSFILGAAGLLKGYRATTHWTMVEELTYFGAEPVSDRVVRDRNRVTGAGVTSGIDFGLVLLALLCGENTARQAQLMLEYDPDPPFVGGSPKNAAPEMIAKCKTQFLSNRERNMPYAENVLYSTAVRLGVI